MISNEYEKSKARRILIPYTILYATHPKIPFEIMEEMCIDFSSFLHWLLSSPPPCSPLNLELVLPTFWRRVGKCRQQEEEKNCWMSLPSIYTIGNTVSYDALGKYTSHKTSQKTHYLFLEEGNYLSKFTIKS